MLLGPYFSVPLSVTLQLLQFGAVLAEFFDGLLHLGTQAVEVVFGLLHKGIQNVLDEFVTSLGEIHFEFAGVEFYELLIFVRGLILDVTDIVVDIFNHSTVSTDWVVDSFRFDLRRVSLDESLATSVGSHRLDLFDFTGVLPGTAISFHLDLYLINNFGNVVGQLIDVLAFVDLVNIGLIIRFPFVRIGQTVFGFERLVLLLLGQVIVVVVSAHSAARSSRRFQLFFVVLLDNNRVLATEDVLKSGYS